MIVVDDVILHAILSGQRNPLVEPYLEAVPRGEVFTTMSWFWRLSRALAHPAQGALSRAFARLSEEEQRRVRSSLSKLPETIGLVSSRIVVPMMAALPGQLNMLTAEAVAAALLLDAKIAVTTESPLLRVAADAAGVEVEIVG